ncbi:hypothetical protein IAT40_006386 [Kwoniella sp. CBS 6097]
MTTDQPDLPSTTPLDLLINAIAGSSRYAFPSDGAEENLNIDANVQSSSNLTAAADPKGVDAKINGDSQLRIGHKRPRQDRSPSPRQKKLAKTLASYVVATSSPSSSSLSSISKGAKAPMILRLHPRDLEREGARGDTESRIEVWHPTTGQKSYGKERRILAPPPILRVSGAILPSISSVTLSTSTNTSNPTFISGSETHRILRPMTEVFPPEPEVTEPDNTNASTNAKSSGRKSKKADKRGAKRKLRQAARDAGFGATLAKTRGSLKGKDMSALIDGLGFPGLWVGEEVGKIKEFLLDLKIELEAGDDGGNDACTSAQPETRGDSSSKGGVGSKALQDQTIDVNPPTDVSGGIVSAEDLGVELDTASLEALQPLAEAVQQANQISNDILADHLALPTSAEGVSEIIETNIDPTLTDMIVAPKEDSDVTPQADSSSIKIVTSQTWATFTSAPLRIVSKPSQKTAKARSMASCFSVSASFALWTRIHGQTVRTKYMKLELGDTAEQDGNVSQPRMVSKTGKWTPFKFDVVRRAAPPPVDRSKNRYHHSSNPAEADNEDKLTYGSIVVLVDLQSGIRSDPVKLVKVESGEVRVGEDEGQPISELQRIGLVRLVDGVADTTGAEDGGRWYLSAPGARLGGGELLDWKGAQGQGRNSKKASTAVTTLSSTLASNVVGIEPAPPYTLNDIEPPILTTDAKGQIVDDVHQPQIDASEDPDQDQVRVAADAADARPKKKLKTKRNALAAAVLAEDDDGSSQNLLTWTQSIRKVDNQGLQQDPTGQAMEEKVEDWMTWIIGGVSCFTYSFFPTSDDPSSALQTKTIDPVPRILIPPVFHSNSNTLNLHLSEFFFPSSPSSLTPPSSSSSTPLFEPLEVYLGPIGPLYVTTWRSTAPRNLPTLAIPYLDNGNGNDNTSTTTNHYPSDRAHGGVMSSFPADLKHVIVVVHMPDADEILGAMRSCAAGASAAELTEGAKLQEVDEQRLEDGADTVEGNFRDKHPTDTHEEAIDGLSNARVSIDQSESTRTGGLPPQNQAQTQDQASRVEEFQKGSEEEARPVPEQLLPPDNLSIAAALEMAPNLNDFGAYNPFSEHENENEISHAQNPDLAQGRDDALHSHVAPPLQSGREGDTLAIMTGSGSGAVNGKVEQDDLVGKESGTGNSNKVDQSRAGDGGDEDETIDPSLRQIDSIDPAFGLRAKKDGENTTMKAAGEPNRQYVHDGDMPHNNLLSNKSESTKRDLDPDNGSEIQQQRTRAQARATLTLHAPSAIAEETNRPEKQVRLDESHRSGDRSREREREADRSLVPLVPLPLLLLRRSDGLVFRTNRSVVAEPMTSSSSSSSASLNPSWSLRSHSPKEFDMEIDIDEGGNGDSARECDGLELQHGWGLRIVED